MIIACPTCGKSTRYDTTNTFRPFCSERCKLIDLGEWASGSRSIAGEAVDAQTLGEHLLAQHQDTPDT